MALFKNSVGRPTNNFIKQRLIIKIFVIVLVVICSIILLFNCGLFDKETKLDGCSYNIVRSKNEYNKIINNHKYSIHNYEQEDLNFNKYNYLLIYTFLEECSYISSTKTFIKNNTFYVKYKVFNKKGYCSSHEIINAFKLDKKIKKVKVLKKENFNINKTTTYNDTVVKKPMIYIYPTEDIDLIIKFNKANNLLSTYPKYKNSWNVFVTKNGNIYDYNTKRNYYGLYWEGKNDFKLDMSDGFVVKGKETVKFLEEKLEYLGLNEREIEECITYWINRLESSKYNFIRFKTTDEVNKYMPLIFSKNPDTLIRIIIQMKPLDKKIYVKEQKLINQERKGFSIIEWGGIIY